MTYNLDYKLPNGRVMFAIEWERGYRNAIVYEAESENILKEFTSMKELSDGFDLELNGRTYHIQLTKEAKGIEVTRDGMHLLGSKLNPQKLMGGFSMFGWAGFTLFGFISAFVNFGGYPVNGEIFIIVSFGLAFLTCVILLIGAIFLSLKMVNGFYIVLAGLILSFLSGLCYFFGYGLYVPIVTFFFLIGVFLKIIFAIPFLKIRKSVRLVKVHNEQVAHFWQTEDSL